MRKTSKHAVLEASQSTYRHIMLFKKLTAMK